MTAPADRAPMPRLRLRVGITGHSPNKLPAGSLSPLRDTLVRVLRTISETAREAQADSDPSGAPSLVLVSSLAEGADRIAARVALDAGWSLQCPLPFPQAEYEADFADDESRREFRELFARAEAVLILDGLRTPGGDMAAGRPYEAAGLIMQQASDLIVAVWDGHLAAGLGGTALVVERALADVVPVVAIDPSEPTAARLMWSGLSRLAPDAQRAEHLLAESPDAFGSLPGVVKALVAPPGAAVQAERLDGFLAERDVKWRPWAWYPLMLGIFGVKRPAWSDVSLPGDVPAGVAALRAQGPPASRDRGLMQALEGTLLPAFVLADRLAIYYAGVYRSAFVFNYIAAALAVALALAGIVAEEHKATLVSVELIIIGSIVWNTRLGWRRDWHRRWMDYRRLAETLRHMRFSILVGSSGRLRRPAGVPHEKSGDWVDWYARRVLRQLPLPTAIADKAYLEGVSGHVVEDELRPQVAYHQSNWKRMTAISERLHVAGLVCFGLTIAACVSFGLAKGWDAITGSHVTGETFKHWVTIATAFFPTLGASLNAIRVQGDFHKSAERSLETLRRLKTIDGVMTREAAEYKVTVALLSDRIDKVGLAMMADLEEWQLLTETRPLSLPA